MLIGKWYGHQRKFSEPQNQYCNDCNYPFDDCCFIFISSISTKEYSFSLSETNIWTWYSRYFYDLANLFYHGFFNVFITRPCMQMVRDVYRMYQYMMKFMKESKNIFLSFDSYHSLGVVKIITLKYSLLHVYVNLSSSTYTAPHQNYIRESYSEECYPHNTNIDP